MFWALSNMRVGHRMKRRRHEPRFVQPLYGVPMPCEEASCQMDGQCFRSNRKTFHLTNACRSTKTKTWNTVHPSWFCKSRRPTGHAFFPTFPVTAGSGSGTKLPTAHYSHRGRVGSMTSKANHPSRSSLVSMDRYVLTCLYF